MTERMPGKKPDAIVRIAMTAGAGLILASILTTCDNKIPIPNATTKTERAGRIVEYSLPDPKKAIEKITAEDVNELIATYYSELNNTEPKSAFKINTSYNNAYLLNFTDRELDPEAALKTYLFCETLATSKASSPLIIKTLNGVKIPYTFELPKKATSIIFIVSPNAPDSEWILKNGGSDKAAGTILEYRPGINLTRIKTPPSSEKDAALLVSTQIIQATVGTKTPLGDEISLIVSDSFSHSLAVALDDRSLGKSYPEYINRHSGAIFKIGNNDFLPSMTFGKDFYSKLPIISPIIKSTSPEVIYPDKKQNKY